MPRKREPLIDGPGEPLTPEVFIRDWFQTEYERGQAWEEFIALGLLKRPEQYGPEIPFEEARRRWWADYEPPSARVYQFKKVASR